MESRVMGKDQMGGNPVRNRLLQFRAQRQRIDDNSIRLSGGGIKKLRTSAAVNASLFALGNQERLPALCNIGRKGRRLLNVDLHGIRIVTVVKQDILRVIQLDGIGNIAVPAVCIVGLAGDGDGLGGLSRREGDGGLRHGLVIDPRQGAAVHGPVSKAGGVVQLGLRDGEAGVGAVVGLDQRGGYLQPGRMVIGRPRRQHADAAVRPGHSRQFLRGIRAVLQRQFNAGGSELLENGVVFRALLLRQLFRRKEAVGKRLDGVLNLHHGFQVFQRDLDAVDVHRAAQIHTRLRQHPAHPVQGPFLAVQQDRPLGHKPFHRASNLLQLRRGALSAALRLLVGKLRFLRDHAQRLQLPELFLRRFAGVAQQPFNLLQQALIFFRGIFRGQLHQGKRRRSGSAQQRHRQADRDDASGRLAELLAALFFLSHTVSSSTFPTFGHRFRHRRRRTDRGRGVHAAAGSRMRGAPPAAFQAGSAVPSAGNLQNFPSILLCRQYSRASATNPQQKRAPVGKTGASFRLSDARA